MFEKFIKFVFNPKWVVIDDPRFEDSPELVLSIRGVLIGLYNGDVIFYSGYETRLPGKREFGESLHPG